MKLSRKILPALAMLLVSAIMLTTASFAWFAMNRSVEANGMSVNIQSDSVYLLIADGTKTAEEIQTAKATVATGTPTGTLDIFPTAHHATKGSEFDTVGKWYTKSADDPSSSASTGSETALTDFNEYVVRYTYSLVLAAGSNEVSNLVLTSFTFTASDDSAASGAAQTLAPVRAVIACGDNYVEVKNGDEVPSTVLAATVNDTDVVTLKVYIYYDGNDTSVYTNNIANLEDVDFTFTVGVPNT
ncbi:MAG: hypothetical protein IJD79_01305 [Clostridia bacterium]|nr:hypothetical protein [Clostridia bacterium]